MPTNWTTAIKHISPVMDNTNEQVSHISMEDLKRRLLQLCILNCTKQVTKAQENRILQYSMFKNQSSENKENIQKSKFSYTIYTLQSGVFTQPCRHGPHAKMN